mgnify:CR=1 FL=1
MTRWRAIDVARQEFERKARIGHTLTPAKPAKRGESKPDAKLTPLEPTLAIQLTLPWPPSANHYVRHTRAGKHYVTQAVKTFRLEVWNESKQRRIPLQTGPLVLHIEAHPPDKRRRDADNLVKCTADALQKAGVVADDYQFEIVTVKRMEPIKGGVLQVRIYSA